MNKETCLELTCYYCKTHFEYATSDVQSFPLFLGDMEKEYVQCPVCQSFLKI